MAVNSRTRLGPFMNAVCFQYLRINTEDVAGRAPIVAAGYRRGQDVVEHLALRGKVSDPTLMCDLLNAALGADGTRLCIIETITCQGEGSYEVRLTESACTINQVSDEPLCAFTLGVFVGALSALTGQRLMGKETECQASGAPMCIYQISPI